MTSTWSLRDATSAWARGWAAARGWASVISDGYVVVDVGLPDRAADCAVALVSEPAGRDRGGDDVLDAVIERVLGSGVPMRLTVATADPGTVRARLVHAGLVPLWVDRLMAHDLAGHSGRVAPDGVTILATRSDAPDDRVRIDVTLTDGQARAASGRVAALPGGPAVFDAIATEPAHRRRGLGTVVMGELAAAAHEHGATSGLLVASSDGHALYSALGWQVLTEVVIVRTP